jgi:HlyD family secretion protein
VRERDRLRDLATRRLASQAAFDVQAAQAEAAEASWREAQAALRELRDGTRDEQLRQAARSVEQAEAAVRELQLTGVRLEVRAPRDAVVDALPWKVGERPPRGATVVVLLAGTPYARIRVPADRRLQVEVGTPARVRVDGVDAALRGRVRHLSGEAAFTPYYSLSQGDRSRLSYLAEVEILDPAAAALPAGLPVEVELLPGRAQGGGTR